MVFKVHSNPNHSVISNFLFNAKIRSSTASCQIHLVICCLPLILLSFLPQLGEKLCWCLLTLLPCQETICTWYLLSLWHVVSFWNTLRNQEFWGSTENLSSVSHEAFRSLWPLRRKPEEMEMREAALAHHKDVVS